MENFCEAILMTFFGDNDVIATRHWNDVTTDFFKVRLRHNQFEKTQFG